jgi:hypothetical protein
MTGRQIIVPANILSALLDGFRNQISGRRPIDRDRIAVYCGIGSSQADSKGLAINTCFEETINRVDEIIAMRLGVKTKDAAT